jgi:two-component system, cell cycle response regulator
VGVDEFDEDTTATNIAVFVEESDDGRRDRPCLTVLTGNSSGNIHKLAQGTHVIGRKENCEIRITDDGISRQHARIRLDGGFAYVEDLQSRNGTFVNGRRILDPTPLHDGDKIQVGRTTVMRYALQDALDESFTDSLLSNALRDPLTKLFNKRYLMDRLDSELKFAHRHETAVSILMLDLDHFKRVNDTYGHLAGDAVLAHVSAALIKAVRNEDVVARFGGEEIVIILRSISLELALMLGERLRRLVENSQVKYQDSTIDVTVSVGVAGFPSTHAETVAQLVEAADKALYRAKHAGRNTVSK